MNRIVRLTDGNDTLADAAAIHDWGLVLAALITHPNADAGVAQMHRVAWQIIDHARAIRLREEARARRCA
jgi:hypothetical protein